MSFRFNVSRLDFIVTEGSFGIDSQTIQATAHGATNKEALLSAEVTGVGIQTPIGVKVDSASRTASFTIAVTQNLQAGTFSGTITFKACEDASCKVQYDVSPRSIPYTVRVQPDLKLSSNYINLAAVETGSATSSISFNPNLAGSVAAAVEYHQGSGWLSAPVSGNNVLLDATAATLGESVYSATIKFTVQGQAHTYAARVNLSVGAGVSIPQHDEITIGSSSTPQQMQGVIDIAVAPGASITRWEAVSQVPWLTLTNASGDFNSDPQWQIDTARFKELEDGYLHRGLVTITTDGSGTPKTYTLFAYKSLAEITSLDTLALFAGEGGPVTLYGKNFQWLTAGNDAIQVNSVAPLAIERVSDSEVKILMPGLREGNYLLTVNSANGMQSGTLRKFIVTPRRSYAYQALETAGLQRALQIVTRSKRRW